MGILYKEVSEAIQLLLALRQSTIQNNPCFISIGACHEHYYELRRIYTSVYAANVHFEA
jgi:hypothetical protein